VKTRIWPESGCVIDSGKKNVNQGESTDLKIKNSKECSEAGVGYSMYQSEDKNDEHLIGYLSHRFRDGNLAYKYHFSAKVANVYSEI